MKKDLEKTNKKIKTIKTTTQIIAITLTSILIYNIFLVLLSNISKKNSNLLFGYKAYIIATNSMEPDINEGDVVVIFKAKENNLKVGNVITFKKNQELITHRIIEIRDKGIQKEYITKGDNNNVEDTEEVRYSQIQGVHVLTIPFLGTIVIFIQNHFFLIILTLLIIVIGIYFMNRKQKAEEKSKIRRKKKEIEDEKFKNENAK